MLLTVKLVDGALIQERMRLHAVVKMGTIISLILKLVKNVNYHVLNVLQLKPAPKSVKIQSKPLIIKYFLLFFLFIACSEPAGKYTSGLSCVDCPFPCATCRGPTNSCRSNYIFVLLINIKSYKLFSLRILAWKERYS